MKTIFSAILAALACATLHGAGKPFEMTGQIMMIADTTPRRLHVLTHDSPDNLWACACWCGRRGGRRGGLRYVAKGFNNTEIANMVGIGRDCVKAHLSAAFTRLEASSRSEAVAIAIRLGLIQG